MRLEDLFLALDRAFNRLISEFEKKRSILEEERLRRLLVLGLLVFIALLLSGWPYVMVYRSPLLPYGMAISPDQLGQGSIEALIVGLLYVICVSALYWLHGIWSKGRGSSVEIIVALNLIVISILLFYWAGSLKTS